MTLARADRVCRWRDDLQFDMSGERTERPRQQFQYQLAAPNNIGLGQLDADPAKRGTELTADPEGAYSWLATVCPTSDPTQFTVSIVVFYNRSVTVDQELACGINLFGGGDGTLYVPTSGTPPGYDPAAVRERIMALRPGDWILLRGVNATATVYGFKWYRVAALGDFVAVPTATANGSRLVTLAGPDWDPSFVPPPTGTGMTEVGLFDNHQVVGVYTETVQVGR
jgi:hypothetical protein